MNYKLLVIILISLSIKAQKSKKIDINYEVKYLVEFQRDSTDIESINSELTILKIGDGYSEYISINELKRDSIIQDYKDRGKAFELLSKISSLPKALLKWEISKDFKDNKITHTEKIFRSTYYYQEDISNLKWNIVNEKKEILGYSCQKATLNYSGRNYIAWFTTALPFSDGPYKFCGLPGLIMSIQDTKEQYKFNLVELKKVLSKKQLIINHSNHIELSKEKFFELQKNVNDDPFAKLANSGLSIKFKDEAQKKAMTNKFKKNNNQIEKIAQ